MISHPYGGRFEFTYTHNYTAPGYYEVRYNVVMNLGVKSAGCGMERSGRNTLYIGEDTCEWGATATTSAPTENPSTFSSAEKGLFNKVTLMIGSVLATVFLTL